MHEDAEAFRKWRRSVEPLHTFSRYTDGALTLTECKARLQERSERPLEELSVDELIDMVFDYAFREIIQPAFMAQEKPELDRDLALRSAFLKYLMAQIYIFDVFDFVPESDVYRKRIIACLLQHLESLTQDDIDAVRGIYNQFVDILRDRDAISEEDQEMYKEVFPHFPPSYISYDRDPGNYEAIAAVSERILNVF